MPEEKSSKTKSASTEASTSNSPAPPAATTATAIDPAEGAKAMSALNAVEAPQDVIPEGFDLSKVMTINAAREEAKIPEHKKAAAIIGRPTVFVSWRAQKALLRSDGSERPGYFCVCIDVETGRPFTIWIGQTVLFKELSRLKPPFRATIELDGRTLKFA